jgi:hypothetical protein
MERAAPTLAGLSDEMLHRISGRYENSSPYIGGFSYGQWAVVRDMRVPGDMNDVLYRGHCMDREAYHRALSIARMRYALELLTR